MTSQIWSTETQDKVCRFCGVGARSQKDNPWDEPLFESAHFSVVPSLGSLVEGWLLVLPKQHLISAAQFPPLLLDELWAVVSIAREVLHKHYGPVWLFEHGPASEKREVGCSVDHAHVHLVPIAADIIEAAGEFLPPELSFTHSGFEYCQASCREGKDYLFVQSPWLETKSVAASSGLGSQIFRKAVAQSLGRRDQFDWRTNPNIENALRTIERVRADFEDISSSAAFGLAAAP
jgi:ATP adenylyltransferase